jgi:hypothetical protein
MHVTGVKMSVTVKSNVITWDNNHKRYVKNYGKAMLIAYEKAFYFENVRVNGILVTRSF